MKFLVFTLALLVAACGDGTATNTVTLPLVRVDGQALPVTLPSGTGTVQVTGGRLVGSRFGPNCEWRLEFGAEVRTGTIVNCGLAPEVGVSLSLDVGGPPVASGSHTYSFGVQ